MWITSCGGGGGVKPRSKECCDGHAKKGRGAGDDSGYIRISKRVASLFIVAVMCISAAVAGLVLLFREKVEPKAATWSDSEAYDSDWYYYVNNYYGLAGCPYGEGTETNPIKISNAAQLGAFAALIRNTTNRDFLEKYVVLENNIDLGGKEWKAIGDGTTGSKYFRGVFDGNNKKITNMLVTESVNNGSSKYYGLFGYVNGYSSGEIISYAVIKNLALHGEISITDYLSVGNYSVYVGGISANGSSYTEFNNCSFSGAINVLEISSDSSAVRMFKCGGVVYGGTNIINCVNYADIDVYINLRKDATSQIGGVAYQGSNIVNCINNGNITNNVASGTGGSADPWIHSGIGGIVYQSSGSITNCVNNGDISNTGNFNYTSFIVQNNTAGIVACASGTFNYSGCTNNGKIVGMGNPMDNRFSGHGGIVGFINSGATAGIYNCVNNGGLMVQTNATTGLGGIIGNAYAKDSSVAIDVTVKNCVNLKSYLAIGSNVYFGGIIGYSGSSSPKYSSSKKILIDNCYSLADNRLEKSYGLYGMIDIKQYGTIVVNNSYFKEFGATPSTSPGWGTGTNDSPTTASVVYRLDSSYQLTSQVEGSTETASGSLISNLNARASTLGIGIESWVARTEDGAPVPMSYIEAENAGFFDKTAKGGKPVVMAGFTNGGDAATAEVVDEMRVEINTNTTGLIVPYVTFIMADVFEIINIDAMSEPSEFVEIADICKYKIWYANSNRQEVTVVFDELKASVAVAASGVMMDGMVTLHYVGGINEPESEFGEINTTWYFNTLYANTMVLPSVVTMNGLAEKAGHSKVFVGWYEDAECTIEIVPDATGKIKIPVSWAGENKEVYAKWSA